MPSFPTPLSALDDRVAHVAVDRLALVAAARCSCHHFFGSAAEECTWGFTWAHGRKLTCFLYICRFIPNKSPGKVSVFIALLDLLEFNLKYSDLNPNSPKCLVDKWTRRCQNVPTKMYNSPPCKRAGHIPLSLYFEPYWFQNKSTCVCVCVCVCVVRIQETISCLTSC